MAAVMLTEREQRVLDAVIQTYVETAEPAGSRTVAKRYRLGVSPATVRNTMADLEEKGFLYHPHTSAGRIPTDHAYRYYVDTLMRPSRLTRAERRTLQEELGSADVAGPLERLVRRATQAMGLLTGELGVAIAPSVDAVVLERLELVAISSEKVLLVLTLRNGIVRTVYVDLPLSVPRETLLGVTVVLNERLAGQSMAEIRRTLPERLKDAAPANEAANELLNIFLQSGDEFFDLSGDEVHLGHTSVLANQPEFESGQDLRGLIELTERRDLLAHVLTRRDREGGLQISIGSENAAPELNGFTLVTGEYRVGDLAGVIGVIGPTRMPYDKVVTIVDSTSRIVSQLYSSASGDEELEGKD